MMKLQPLAVIAMALAVSTALSATQPPSPAGEDQSARFADIPWGSSPAATREALEKAGFTFARTTKDGDLAFSGTVINHKAELVAMQANGTLSKISILFPLERFNAIPFFKEIEQTLVARYGDGKRMVAFAPPYREGDGHEETAIAVNKGVMAHTWPNGLSVGILQSMNVLLAYESSTWPAESARRKANNANILGGRDGRGGR